MSWSKKAYKRQGDPSAWCNIDDDDDLSPSKAHPWAHTPSTPLYPLIKLSGPNQLAFEELFAPERGRAVPHSDFIDVSGLLNDDVPIVFGDDHPGVYLRCDVAAQVRPHLAPSQRLIPVCGDGEPTTYLALTDSSPRVWLADDWCYLPCAKRSAPEFDDGTTLITPIFPDAFDPESGVHFVGNYSNFFVDRRFWTSLCAQITNLADWLSPSQIVVDAV